MNQFEIHDDNGVLFRGSMQEAMKIWEVLKTGRNGSAIEYEKGKHLIPFDNWYGNLKIVSIIEEENYQAGIHKV